MCAPTSDLLSPPFAWRGDVSPNAAHRGLAALRRQRGDPLTRLPPPRLGRFAPPRQRYEQIKWKKKPCTSGSMNKWVTGILRTTYQGNIYAEYCHLLPQSAYSPGCTYILPYDHSLSTVSKFMVEYLNVSLDFGVRANTVSCNLHAANLTLANAQLIRTVYARDFELVSDAVQNWSHFTASN